MSNFNVNDLIQSLETNIETIAKTSLQGYESAAKADAINVVNDLKTSIEAWAAEVETGALTKTDVEYLLKEQASLDEMTALKQAGLAQIRIDTFRNDVINSIISTIFNLVKI